MYTRQSIVLRVLKAFAEGAKEILIKTPDPEKDHKLLSKMFHRRGEDVGISKDPFKEGLWFRKK